MKRTIRTIILATASLLVFGCGSGGSGSGGAGGGGVAPGVPPANNSSIVKTGGDGQVAVMGDSLAQPLSVVVYDQSGAPAANCSVTFSVLSGAGGLSSTSLTTGSDGVARVNLTLGADLSAVQVRAAASGAGQVDFTVTPLLPTLGEIADGQTGLGPVSALPVVLGALDDGQDALAILLGDEPGVDMSVLPTVGDILGGEINGVAVEDYAAVFVPGDTLVDSLVTVENPTASLVASRRTANGAGADINVVTDLVINGDAAVAGLLGDASGMAGVSRLGDLLDSGATVDVDGVATFVGDLPMYVINVADYPADPAADNYSYSSLGSSALPLFSGLEPLGETSAAAAIPSLSGPLPTLYTEGLTLTGGSASADVKLLQTPAISDVSAPLTALSPLPVQWVPVFNVVEEQLIPAMEASQPVQDMLSADVNSLVQSVQDNWGALQSLMNSENGGNFDVIGTLTAVNAILPSIDDLAQDFQLLIPFIEQQLDIVETDLIPAIQAALPADGIPFGGYSDGNPSTVADDVIPFIQGEIDVLQATLPDLSQLLADIDALIPDNGNLFVLIGNVFGGGLDNILADVEALVPHVADSLVVFDNLGVPILYDVLEEAEQVFTPGASPVSDTAVFQGFVDSLAAAYPSDATLGDLPGFQYMAPVLSDILPAEWGDPANVSIFDTALPTIGDVDVGADILPALRNGLDSLDAALPNIIDGLYNFQGFNFSFI